MVNWLKRSGWQTTSPDDARQLVAGTREELAERDPSDGRIPRLEALERGSAGEAEFQSLFGDWDNLIVDSEANHILPHLLRAASELPDEEWETELYWGLHDAILDYSEGTNRNLAATSTRVRQRLQAAWASYESALTQVVGNTGIAEAGNRLLSQSFAAWFQSLDAIDAALAEGSGFGPALRILEQASRLMTIADKQSEILAAS